MPDDTPQDTPAGAVPAVSRLVYTIPEVAAALGIGRSAAYEMARGGAILGVPVLHLGRRLVVPRAALEQALGLATRAEPEPQPAPSEGRAPEMRIVIEVRIVDADEATRPWSVHLRQRVERTLDD
jgi:hypothetical protein